MPATGKGTESKSGAVMVPEVCVHGDAHLGNIMWHQGNLRLIDFDMTGELFKGLNLRLGV